MSKANNTAKRVNFTIGRVTKFTCPQDKSESKLWDETVKSLILRARPTGSKVYYFQSRFNNKLIKIKIGDESSTTIENARAIAINHQRTINEGKDPREEIRRTVEKEVKQTQEREKGSVTLIEIWNEYIQSRKHKWSKNHLRDHHNAMASPNRSRKRSKLKTVEGPLYQLKDKKIKEFTPSLLKEWLIREKRNRPTVASRAFRLLRACLYWADEQDGKDTKNNYKGIINAKEIFKKNIVKDEIPTPNDKKDSLEKNMLPIWFKAVKSIDNIVISAYLQTQLLIGARRDELANLKWDDVDFKWESLIIKDKVEGTRIIPLTPYVAKLLNDLPRRNEWVFSSPQSESGHLEDPYKKHSQVVASAGLPHITIHGLRRSFSNISEWVVECPAGVVSQIMGHKPSATAEKHYKDRPLDLLRMWHTKIEKEILDFAGIEQPIDEADEGLRSVK